MTLTYFSNNTHVLRLQLFMHFLSSAQTRSCIGIDNACVSGALARSWWSPFNHIEHYNISLFQIMMITYFTNCYSCASAQLLSVSFICSLSLTLSLKLCIKECNKQYNQLNWCVITWYLFVLWTTLLHPMLKT